MEKTLYSIKGTKAGSITLPSSLFEAKWNADLVHQVITSMESNQRANTAHTQNRGNKKEQDVLVMVTSVLQSGRVEV